MRQHPLLPSTLRWLMSTAFLKLLGTGTFLPINMQIVSFDFGTKKIGIAVGQTETKTSSPLEVIFNKNNAINWDSIESIISEWKPDLLLVGKPLNMDGSDSDIMEKVDIFFKKLEKITRVPCEYVDERLTSFEARQNISELKTDLVDAHAAKILIDHWFNK